jgi:uroporphyrinogen decarboxylase
MSKFELLRQTFLGNLDQQIPLSLWKHHPERDRIPESLAEEEIKFHREYDHDLMKISFHGRYPVVDWGCEVVYDGALSGSTTCKNCAITQPSDWETLEALDVNDGEFGKQVRAVELIHKYAQDKVPTVSTVFGPPMVADKLCEKDFLTHLDDNPEVMEQALEMITNVMVDFGRATIEAGADGIFLASQHSTLSSASDKQYERFIYPYEKKLISKLKGKAKFIIMHLHAREENEEIRFEKIANTSGLDAINWEDQSANLTLADGKKLSRKAVLGGIDHNGVFRTGSPEEANEQVLGALREAGMKRLIIAPGCVITVDTPPENIKAIVDSIRNIKPWSKEWEGHA